MTKKAWVLNSENDTEQFAKELAATLRGNEVIALVGDLGAGKTTFTQMLAKALGVKQRVMSPTFVIHRRYKLPNKKHLSHFDMYRLTTADLDGLQFDELLGEDLVIIEWADRIRQSIPKDAIWIELQETSKGRKATIKK